MPDIIPIREYNSNQIILNSDRVILNSKQDNVIVSANKDVSINMNGSFHMNVGSSGKQSADSNYMIVNAKKVQLGTGDVEPITKANTMADLLNELLDALNELAINLSTSTGIGVGTVSEPTVNFAGQKLKGQVSNIQSTVDKIKSTVSFTS